MPLAFLTLFAAARILLRDQDALAYTLDSFDRRSSSVGREIQPNQRKTSQTLGPLNQVLSAKGPDEILTLAGPCYYIAWAPWPQGLRSLKTKL